MSWGSVLLVVGGPSGIPATAAEIEKLMPFVIRFMLLGPGVAAALVTALVDGQPGFRPRLGRLLIWRVKAGWYVVALLTAPVAYTVVLLALSCISPVFQPGIVTATNGWLFVLTGVAAALMVGIFAEFGWTGFAIPRLRFHHGVVSTGLIAGVLWGAWPILTNVLGQLPAFRVLIVAVYDRTGSLLMAMLMHFSFTASTFILEPADITGVPLLVSGLVLGAAMWIVAVPRTLFRQRWEMTS
jgi:membrane protease YdiL (CAAX protease family)